MAGSSSPIAKQAGVGLMLGEDSSIDGVIVKQLVPRGSADRTGKIHVGDHLLRVGDVDVTGQKVHEMRHLIIGDIGSICPIVLRSSTTNQVYNVDLMRGTPEYFDSLAGGSSVTGGTGGSASSAVANPRSTVTPSDTRSIETIVASRMYSSGGSAIVDLASRPMPRGSTLQEENDWLKSALRLAETHILKGKEELRSLYDITDRNKQEIDLRNRQYQEQISRCDADKREAEQRAWKAEEGKRAADIKLAEALRREQTSKDETKKMYENEQMRIEYIQELKQAFEADKAKMEEELVKMHDSLRLERAKRAEAENTCNSLRQNFNQAMDAYRHVVEKNNQASEKLRSESEALREIQRYNSSLTLLLSEIQPRLTVLEQDLYGSKVDFEGSIQRAASSKSIGSFRKPDEIIMA